VSAVLRGSVLESSWRTRATTAYRLEPRGEAARFVVVEHPKRAGFTVASPADPVETANAWRFGVTLGAEADGDPTVPTHLVCDGEACVLTVVMERIDGRRLSLTNAGGDQLAFFLANVELSATDRAALEALLEAQRGIAELDRQVVALEAQVNELFRDQARIRDNMLALDRNATLYRRYLADLEAQENELVRLRETIAGLRAQRVELQRERDALIEALAEAVSD